MQVLHDEAEASEILQDVFCQVWEHANHYSASKGRLACLAGSAPWQGDVRLIGYDNRVPIAAPPNDTKIACRHFENCFDRFHAVERQVFDNDLRSLLRQHLINLPAQQREMIRLAFFEQKSQREISSLTNIPLGMVKTRIELGLKKLSKRLIEKRHEVL